MSKQNKVTGVVLAGGLARRMNQQDKGLILYQNQPMVSYALKALSPIVDTLLINANRNTQAYTQFGYEVISDQTDTFDGPLAGVLSALNHTNSELLMVIPCDSPLVKAQHLSKLLTTLTAKEVDIAVAFDGERLQPVFMALKTHLQSSLHDYLAAGNRKIDGWLKQHPITQVDFSQTPDIFLNINTMTELKTLENRNNDPI